MGKVVRLVSALESKEVGVDETTDFIAYTQNTTQIDYFANPRRLAPYQVVKQMVDAVTPDPDTDQVKWPISVVPSTFPFNPGIYYPRAEVWKKLDANRSTKMQGYGTIVYNELTGEVTVSDLDISDGEYYLIVGR